MLALRLLLFIYLFLGGSRRSSLCGAAGPSVYCTCAADVLSSSVLLVLHHLPRQRDRGQIRVRRRRRLLLLLLDATTAASRSLSLSQRVDHGHVDVEVVRLLEALPADHALELQVGLGLVLGHVVLQGRSLPTLEAAHLASGGKEWKRGH